MERAKAGVSTVVQDPNASRNLDVRSQSNSSTAGLQNRSFVKAKNLAQGKRLFGNLAEPKNQTSSRSTKQEQSTPFAKLKTRPSSKSNSQLHSRKHSAQLQEFIKDGRLQFLSSNFPEEDSPIP